RLRRERGAQARFAGPGGPARARAAAQGPCRRAEQAGAGHDDRRVHPRAAGGRMIRLVIADDHAIVREGLKRIVAEAPGLQVEAEAADGNEVMKLVRERDFDVLVLDLSMPGRSGMELIKLVK